MEYEICFGCFSGKFQSATGKGQFQTELAVLKQGVHQLDCVGGMGYTLTWTELFCPACSFFAGPSLSHFLLLAYSVAL